MPSCRAIYDKMHPRYQVCRPDPLDLPGWFFTAARRRRRRQILLLITLEFYEWTDKGYELTPWAVALLETTPRDGRELRRGQILARGLIQKMGRAQVVKMCREQVG